MTPEVKERIEQIRRGIMLDGHKNWQDHCAI